jgi:hypothetical protein
MVWVGFERAKKFAFSISEVKIEYALLLAMRITNKASAPPRAPNVCYLKFYSFSISRTLEYFLWWARVGILPPHEFS